MTETSQTAAPPAGAADSAGPSADRSLGDIVGSVAQDLSELMRDELELAKAEAKQEAARAGKGAGMLAGAGIAAHLILVFLSLALMFLLDGWMPTEVAALITAAVWAVIALVLATSGRASLKRSNPALPKTQRSLKEDAAWAKRQKN